MLNAILSSPCAQHWFGTDIIGNDIFIKCANALWNDFAIVIAVVFLTYFLGLCIGILLSYFNSKLLKEFFLSLIHYWITLPVLLISMLLLILAGPGRQNVIFILTFALAPSHALYVYNQLSEAKKQEFALAKISYGFSKSYVYFKHLYPSIKEPLQNYTFSRVPEVLMISLGLNFIGLGIQSPQSSFGRLLFDGLPFMFSAWWLWVFPIAIIIAVFVGLNLILEKL